MSDMKKGWAANGLFLFRVTAARLRFGLAVVIGLGITASYPALRSLWFSWLDALPRSEPSVSTNSEFFCPMDPGVVSAWPAICPVCNMDLIVRAKTDAVLLPEGTLARMQISPYRVQLAGIRTAPLELATTGPSDGDAKLPTWKIPLSSITYRYGQSIVYVESMPGMFDAIAVNVVRRDTKTCDIRGSLRQGQRVAVAGAYLLDAESRLRPNLSAQYFGATVAADAKSPSPQIPRAVAKTSRMESMTEEEKQIIDLQQVCPVTKAELGSMGKPMFVEMKGRRVALCCEGCKDAMQRDFDQYVEWLDTRMSDEKK